MANKIINGTTSFYLKNGYIESDVYEYTKEDKEWTGLYPTEFEIYDIMDGLEFAQCVEDGSFIDSDGRIAHIFVNDLLSNLGIWDKGMHQGKFCLGLYDFRRLCSQYKIEVNWANK